MPTTTATGPVAGACTSCIRGLKTRPRSQKSWTRCRGLVSNNPNGPPARYGWLGGKQRAADDFGDLVLMGVRLYNPNLGRFLQTDPVAGGSCNAYDYTCQDPVNNVDLGGDMNSAFGGGTISIGGIWFDTAAMARRLASATVGTVTASGAIIVAGRVVGHTYNPGFNNKGLMVRGAASDEPSGRESTPATNPEEFEPVRGRPGKRNKETGEIWVKDPSAHGGDHYEVYKNLKAYEKGKRYRDVWNDGRPKRSNL